MKTKQTKKQAATTPRKGKVKVEKPTKETLQDLRTQGSEQVKGGAHTYRNCY